jgi:hypothetical protein
MIGPARHMFPSRVLSGGKSLHPLQRAGLAPAGGLPVKPVGGPVGLGNGAAIPATPLNYPPMQHTGIAAALNRGNVS